MNNPNSVCGFYSDGTYYLVYSESVLPIVIGKKFVKDYLSKGLDFWKKYTNETITTDATDPTDPISTTSSPTPTPSKVIFYNDTLENHFLKRNFTITKVPPVAKIFIVVDLDRNIFTYKYNDQTKISCGLNSIHSFIFDYVNEDSYRLD